MAELIQANWVFLVIALVIGLFVAWWIFAANRKTKVEVETKDDDTAVAKRNQALIDSPPASVATSETAPTPAPVPASPLASPENSAVDDLTKIKGLGPKLKTQLAEMGVTSFAQIAVWDDAEIDRVDAKMGRFQGRIRRDDWVAQAKLLQTGDMAAYESRFGRS